eukprot:6409904-Prorocentrum_lima.AAC.1
MKQNEEFEAQLQLKQSSANQHFVFQEEVGRTQPTSCNSTGRSNGEIAQPRGRSQRTSDG